MGVRRGRPTELTVIKVIWAMKDTGGIYNEIAKKMNLDRETIVEFFEKNPDLEKFRRAEIEKLKDVAESKLYNDIRMGEFPAVSFFLKHKAKDRGYVEKTEISTPRDEPIEIAVFPIGFSPTQIDFKDKKLLEQTALKLIDDNVIEVVDAKTHDRDEDILRESEISEEGDSESGREPEFEELLSSPDANASLDSENKEDTSPEKDTPKLESLNATSFSSALE